MFLKLCLSWCIYLISDLRSLPDWLCTCFHVLAFEPANHLHVTFDSQRLNFQNANENNLGQKPMDLQYISMQIVLLIFGIFKNPSAKSWLNGHHINVWCIGDIECKQATAELHIVFLCPLLNQCFSFLVAQLFISLQTLQGIFGWNSGNGTISSFGIIGSFRSKFYGSQCFSWRCFKESSSLLQAANEEILQNTALHTPEEVSTRVLWRPLPHLPAGKSPKILKENLFRKWRTMMVPISKQKPVLTVF